MGESNKKRLDRSEEARINFEKGRSQMIEIYEKSIANAQEKNRNATKLIEDLEDRCAKLENQFKANNGITYEEAINLVDKEWNPNLKYNQEEVERISILKRQIEGERFFAQERQKLIQYNLLIIDDLKRKLDEAYEERFGSSENK